MSDETKKLLEIEKKIHSPEIKMSDIHPGSTFTKKRKLPKKLIILSVEWDITYFDKQIEVDSDREQRLFGQVNYENNTIRVFRGKREKECIFETIFHEWLHVILTEMGYRDVMGDKNEQFVEAISTCLNDFFWRNFR